jgi:cytochrome c oxidase subunit III
MTVTLVFLAALMGLFVFWLVRQSLNVRPWVAQSIQGHAPALPHGLTAPRVGLAAFIAVATSVFAISISAYSMRMHMGSDWVHLHPPRVLWANTLVLALASVAMQWTWNAARRGDARALSRGLTASGTLSLAFVVGQVLVWRHLDASGFYAWTNPSNSFFYLLTGLHVAHLLGGLVAWLRTAVAEAYGATPARLLPRIELCALYWHYLLLVWAVLFALLHWHAGDGRPAG